MTFMTFALALAFASFAIALIVGMQRSQLRMSDALVRRYRGNV